MDQDAEREVLLFNARHKVGELGFLKKDNGQTVPTALNSEAWVLGGHSAVAMFEGVSGCYKIDRFIPMV
jgi:hypothetical protein